MGKYPNIKIINILSDFSIIENNNNFEYKYDFTIYPASGLKHKNHKLLFEILIELSKENIYPKILTTLEQKYLDDIRFYQLREKYNLKIDNYFEKKIKKNF